MPGAEDILIHKIEPLPVACTVSPFSSHLTVAQSEFSALSPYVCSAVFVVVS